jgi:hypothetical protein
MSPQAAKDPEGPPHGPWVNSLLEGSHEVCRVHQ